MNEVIDIRSRTVLPYDADAERAVLVVALSTPGMLGDAMQIAPPEVYFDRTRQQIARAVTSILSSGQLPDVTSVTRWLAAKNGNNLPHPSEVTELHTIGETPYVANAAQHASVIREHWVRRQRILVDQWRIQQFREGKRPVEEIDVEANMRLAATVGTTERQSGIHTLGPAEIFAQLPPVAWVIRGLDMCPGAPSLFAGYGYSGKSVVLQSMALQIAAGKPVWSAYAAPQGACIHFDYEQGEHLTRLRYQRLAWASDITPQDLGDRLQLVCFPPFYLDEPDSEKNLIELCGGKTLAVIDSFRAACRSTDENSSEARVPLDMLGRVSERTGCAMAVIHHARKPSKDASLGARDAIRGSSALYDACASVFVLEGEPDQPERTMHHVKARVSGKVQDPMSLRIEDSGDPGTDGAPAGLAVTVSKAPTADERVRQATGARFDALRAEVLALFEVGKERRGGIESIAATIRRKPADVRSVIKVLLDEDTIEATGNSTRSKGFRRMR